MLTLLTRRASAPTLVAADRDAFVAAYRTAWSIREFTGGRDPRPIERAVAQHLGPEWLGTGARRAALRALWRSGVQSESTAWKALSRR